MKARITLFSVLLLGAIWAMAQTTPSSSPQGSQGTSSTAPDQTTGPAGQSGTAPGNQGATSPGQSETGMAAGQTGTAASQNSLRGCLGGSPTNGTYYLTDSKSGTTYTLTGGADQLRTHVGQQVEVTGQAMGSGGTSPSANGSGSSTVGDSSTSASGTSSQTGLGRLCQSDCVPGPIGPDHRELV